MKYREASQTHQGDHQISPRIPAQPLERTCGAIHPILRLQQMIGNQAVQRFLPAHLVQAKLGVNEPGNQYEREAERVVEQMVQMSNFPTIGGAAAIRRTVSSGIIQRTPAPPSLDGVTGTRDMSKITIDAIADFLQGSLTASRDIYAHISDPAVVHMTWELYDPSDHMMSGSFSTIPGTPKSTTTPFPLDPSLYKTDFKEGKYLLRCIGLNAKHQPVVYADRDFNTLKSDLTTSTALATTYGDLTFTRYTKTDASPPASPSYSLDVELSFLPNATVACNDVVFMQTVQSIDNQGRSLQHTANAEVDARKTPVAWSIDRIAGAPSPIYIMGRDPKGKVIDVPSWGRAGRGGAKPREATLSDKPSWNQINNLKIESCAICRSGANKGQVYGCATWGYTADAAGKVTLMPRSFRQMPSDQFEEARAAWNTWRASVSVAKRPAEAPALTSP